jgi:hypothetical protein
MPYLVLLLDIVGLVFVLPLSVLALTLKADKGVRPWR